MSLSARPAFTVTRAAPQQVSLVYSLLNDAARCLADQDIRQWQYPFREDIVRASVNRQDTFLAWAGGEPVGTFAIYWDDPLFWGEQLPDAGYLHRLAVASAVRGKGLGARLLDWAAGHVAAHGRPWIRLDCNTENPPLRAFYERNGFRHVRDVELPVPGSTDDPWPASLYERPVSP